MSQYPLSAALPDAADVRIASGLGAHDNDTDHHDMATVPEAAEGIRATSLLPSTNDLDLRPPLQQDKSHIPAAENQTVTCVATTPEPIQVAPSSPSIVLPSSLPPGTTPPAAPPSSNTTTATMKHPPPAAASKHHHHHAPSLLQKPAGGAAGPTNIAHQGMGSASSSHRRRQYANTSALSDYEADLTGRDRAKQKDAVKRFLTENIKDDWKWEWPRSGPDSTPENLPETSPHSAPTTLSQDDSLDAQQDTFEEKWKERDEWTSNASDSGEEATAITARRAEKSEISTKETSLTFESPDCVEEAIKNIQSERKRRRKKRLAEEMVWNDGVRCFVERRNAWTGARRVSRRLVIRTAQLGKSGPAFSEDGSSSTAPERETSDTEDEWDEIPVAPPLLPPTNAMRASITPTTYNTIYDKVILQGLSPSCPINLKDVTRSCVQGWKRDGEWPPKSSVPDSLAGRRRRRLSMASLFGLEKTKSKEEKEKLEKEKAERAADKASGDHKAGPFRRSIQKLLSLGKDKEREHGNGANGKTKDVEVATPA